MQTDPVSRETRNLIASDRVEGTPVRSTDGTPIGTIERVMIDKVTGIVAYAVLSPHGSVEVPQKQLSIPWLDLINGGLGDAPSDASDKDYDRAGRERYWGIAETWRVRRHHAEVILAGSFIEPSPQNWVYNARDEVRHPVRFRPQ